MNDMWNGMIQNGNQNMPNNFLNPNFGYRLPKLEIVKVNGEAGARNFKMAPNSSALLADETAPMIWFVQTDGAGYLTATPYDISPHQTTPPIDVNELAQRVAQLEELINAKSNSQSTKQSKRQQPAANNSTNTNTTL